MNLAISHSIKKYNPLHLRSIMRSIKGGAAKTLAFAVVCCICAVSVTGCASGFGGSADRVAVFVIDTCFRKAPPKIAVGQKSRTAYSNGLAIQWEHMDAYQSLYPQRRYASYFEATVVVQDQYPHPEWLDNLDPAVFSTQLSRRLDPHHVGKSVAPRYTNMGLLLDDTGSNIYLRQYRPKNGLLDFDPPRTKIKFTYFGDPAMSPAQYRKMRMATPTHEAFLELAVDKQRRFWRRKQAQAEQSAAFHRKLEQREKESWSRAAAKAVENARRNQSRQQLYLKQESLPLPYGSPSTGVSSGAGASESRSSGGSGSSQSRECSDRCQGIATSNDGYCCVKGCAGCPCLEGCKVIGDI